MAAVHAWQVLSVTIFAYYLFWDERLFLLPWHSEPWLRGFILIPPIIAVIVALVTKRPPNENVKVKAGEDGVSPRRSVQSAPNPRRDALGIEQKLTVRLTRRVALRAFGLAAASATD